MPGVVDDVDEEHFRNSCRHIRQDDEVLRTIQNVHTNWVEVAQLDYLPFQTRKWE